MIAFDRLIISSIDMFGRYNPQLVINCSDSLQKTTVYHVIILYDKPLPYPHAPFVSYIYTYYLYITNLHKRLQIF